MTPQPAPDRRPLVMVVEDHEDTRSLLKYVMEKHGLLVLEAADGEEAVRLALSQHPDLILMDTTLPYLDGLMATKYIRKARPLRNVPIIFISGQSHPEYKATAIASGANDFLVKPVNLIDLERAVDNQLNKRI